jgi:hypothetical protein
MSLFHYISAHQYFRFKPSLTHFADTAGGYGRLKPFSKYPVHTSGRQFSKMKAIVLSLAVLSLLQLASAQPHRKNSVLMY